MKKTFFFIGGLLMSLLPAFSQTPTGIRPLSIGDTLPEMTFTGLINSPSPTMNLSEHKGKLLILDFWATWCPPCVLGLVKLSKYQQKFKQDIVVVPVNNGSFNDTRTKVAAFLDKRTDINLPTIYDDSLRLPALFPHDGIPHCVIIDREGVVKAITSSRYLTESNLALLVRGGTPNFPLKGPNAATGNDEMNPLVSDTNTLSSFRIYRFVPGAFGTTVSRKNSLVMTTYWNRTIPELYTAAFGKARFIWQQRVIVEPAADTAHYYSSGINDPYQMDAWDAVNRFCYESVVPAKAVPFIRTYMQEDLNRYFFSRYKVSAVLAQRPVRCLKIIKRIPLPTSKEVRLPSKQNGPSFYSWKGVSMEVIANFLTNSKSPLPVINATNDTTPVNFSLEINDFSQLSGLRPQFQRQGFDLVEGVETIEVILIKKQETPNTKQSTLKQLP